MQIHGSYKLSQIKAIGNGIIIGILAGSIVSVFRWSIQHLLVFMRYLYTNSLHHLDLLLACLAINLIISLVVGIFFKTTARYQGFRDPSS